MNISDCLPSECVHEIEAQYELESSQHSLFADPSKFDHLQTKRPKKVSAWQRLEARKEAMQLQKELELLEVK